ncbi:MAG: hypothetical protein HY234_05140 [Acidobacteria bacterium]|nr:hypothetical protein [Acidobacteriota bacterium]MBI3662418.1 hypothetical protein [Acidobacteriota bacterium]
MAEETLVKEPLREEKISAGRKLIELLDTDGIDVVAAYWLFREESNDWRLVLATSLVDSEGPRKTYSRIQVMLDARPDEFPWLNLRNITVVSPEDSFVRVLRTAIRTDRGLHSIRFSRSRINDVFVEDAYIYRAA